MLALRSYRSADQGLIQEEARLIKTVSYTGLYPITNHHACMLLLVSMDQPASDVLLLISDLAFAHAGPCLITDTCTMHNSVTSFNILINNGRGYKSGRG